MKNLFIIDDEKSICNALAFAFEGDYAVFKAHNLREYGAAAKRDAPDIVLLDLKLGADCGLDLLASIKEHFPDAVVIMMTAYGTIESAINAIRAGAYDYILKPLDADAVRELVEKASLYQDRHRLVRTDLARARNSWGMVGCSSQLQSLFSQIDKIKDLDVNVLIEGESGTGKELVAKAIHYSGRRADRSFVVVNCAAMPQTLIESELFGYEKGAFTGADKPKKGAFELADRGSIFLDEIGEMDLYCQAKVLRAIQSKEILPVGGTSARKIDVRIIAATNRKLQEAAETGEFRFDLFYRLNVFPITVPPLRERMEDIPLLVESFIRRANGLYGLGVESITQGALDLLMTMEYRGNIRELENIVLRACILCGGEVIDEACIRDFAEQGKKRLLPGEEEQVTIKLGSRLEDVERVLILNTVDYVNGNKLKASKLLGISERSIHYKLRSYLGEKEL